MDMRKLLRDVVIYGSAKNANIDGYEVAGKTGTANKIEQGRYVKGKNMTSFVAAFPISAPKYAMIVVLDSPKSLKETFGFNTSGWNDRADRRKDYHPNRSAAHIRPNYDLDTQRMTVLKVITATTNVLNKTTDK